MSNKVLVFYPNEFADWEDAFLLPNLAKKKWEVNSVSDTKDLVTSIGGKRVKTDMQVEEIVNANFDLLVLVGGNTWLNQNHDSLAQIVRERLNNNMNVAAICGAVDFLAKNGLLTGFGHTGNSKDFWQTDEFKNYVNEEQFHSVQAYRDKNLVTANGTAPFDFAQQTLNMLGYDDAITQKELDLYRLGFYNYAEKYGMPEYGRPEF